MTRVHSAVLTLITLAVAAHASAPTAVSVSVSVSVLKGDERVTGLTSADFRLLEDGKEQAITSVSEGPGPISVAVVVDAPDRTAGVGQQLSGHSVAQLAAALAPDDEISLLTQDGTMKVAVPWTTGGSFPKLQWAVWKTMPNSEILQGIYQALGLMNEAKNARTAVVAISGAQLAASKYKLQDFVRSRRESEAGIYGLRTSDSLSLPPSSGGPRPGPAGTGTTIWDSRGALISFDDLVRDSGGVVLPARTTSEAERSVSALLANIRRQYVLTFTSNAPADGAYHRLKVELRKDGHKLRHRTGYLATPN